MPAADQEPALPQYTRIEIDFNLVQILKKLRDHLVGFNAAISAPCVQFSFFWPEILSARSYQVT